jgi:hypothetical protein
MSALRDGTFAGPRDGAAASSNGEGDGREVMFHLLIVIIMIESKADSSGLAKGGVYHTYQRFIDD